MSTTAIEEYSRTEAALADLKQRYANTVFDVATTAGMKQAIAARAEVRGYRTSLEKLRKEIKAPALARCNAIDTEAKRITVELEALEEPIHKQIRVEEERKEQERLARIAAEQARVDGIQQAINGIHGAVAVATGQPSAWIGEILDTVRNTELSADKFAEFLDNAKAAKADTIEALEKMLRAAEAQEAEALRLKAEREELVRLRAAEEARQAAERERIAKEEAEAQARRAEADRAAAAERAQQEAKAKAEREEADRLAAFARAAEEQRQAVERERLAAERAELERQRRDIEAAEQRRREEAEVRTSPAKAAEVVGDFSPSNELRDRIEERGGAPILSVEPSHPGAYVKGEFRPSTSAIVEVIATHYRVHESRAAAWLLNLDSETLIASSIVVDAEFSEAA